MYFHGMDTILVNTGREEMSESFYSTEINDEEMARRFAEFKPKKIAGLFEELDIDVWDKQLENLANMISDTKDIKSEQTIQGIKNYVIINMVTVIEDTTKRLLKSLIDSNNFKIKNLFQRDELHIRLESLDSLKSEELTKGAIIASNFNFQNLNEIDYIFSNLFKFNFFETLLKFCELPQVIDGEDAQTYLSNRQLLLKNWNRLDEITEFRNMIVHNINYDVKYDNDEIHLLIDTASVFLLEMVFFTFVIEEVKTPGSTKITDHLELEFGNKFNVYSEIIEKQMKNFKFKRF